MIIRKVKHRHSSLLSVLRDTWMGQADTLSICYRVQGSMGISFLSQRVRMNTAMMMT